MARAKELMAFYCSKEWRTLRTIIILERGNRCEKCNRVFPSHKLIGHHIEELTLDNYKDANISLNKDNIEVECLECHNEEHQRFVKNPYNVFIIYGSPLSGKTSYVEQIFKRGDIVVDIDKIWECISLTPLYDKPENLKYNVFKIYDELIDNIKTRYGKWNNAYIIGGLPDKMKRERLADRLGAELIYINSTREECIERLSNDNGRKYLIDKWQKYINDWWDNYEA